MITIKTNNVPRDIIHGFELTKTEASEFDYYNDEELTEQSFFRYKGMVYDLGEFIVFQGFMSDEQKTVTSGWDGYCSDSYFSATVVKYVNDYESVVVGLLLS